MVSSFFPAFYNGYLKTQFLSENANLTNKKACKSLVQALKESHFETLLFLEAAKKEKNYLSEHKVLLGKIIRNLNKFFSKGEIYLWQAQLSTIYKVAKIFRGQSDVLPECFCIGVDLTNNQLIIQIKNPLLFAAQSDYFYQSFFIRERKTDKTDKMEVPYSEEVLDALEYIKYYLSTGELKKLDQFKVIYEVIKFAIDWKIPRLIKRLPEIFKGSHPNPIILFLLQQVVNEEIDVIRNQLFHCLEASFQNCYSLIRTFEKHHSTAELRAFLLKNSISMLRQDLWNLSCQNNCPEVVSWLLNQKEAFSVKSQMEIDLDPLQSKGKEKVNEQTSERYFEFPKELNSLEARLKCNLAYLHENLINFDADFLESLPPSLLILLLKLIPEKIHALNLQHFSRRLLEIFIPVLPSSLNSIDLSNTILTPRLLETLVSNCPNLEHLNLSDSPFEEPEDRDLNFLSNLNKLKSLNIQRCNFIHADTVNAMIDTCAGSLDTLIMDENIFYAKNDISIKQFRNDLIRQALDFESPIHEKEISSIIQSPLVQRLLKLRLGSILHLKESDILHRVYRHFHHLHSLELNHYEYTDNDLEAIADLSGDSLSATLKNIYLAKSSTTGKGLSALLEKCPNLETLDLEESKITETYMNEILNRLSDKLKNLNIKNMPEIGSPKALAHLPHLQSLTIGNSPYDPSPNPRIKSSLFPAICYGSRDLTKLSLLENFEEKDVVKGIFYLSQLTDLHLEMTSMGTATLKALGKYCPNLNTLGLNTCILGEGQGELFWEELKQAFSSLKNLQILKMTLTYIPQDTFIHIIESLPKLHSIVLNDIGGEEGAQMDQFLMKVAQTRPDIKLFKPCLCPDQQEKLLLQSTYKQIKLLQAIANA